MLLTMDTYVASYEDFIVAAASQMISVRNSLNIGFGMLTSLLENSRNSTLLTEKKQINMDDDTIKKIIIWSRTTNTLGLSLWASTIQPSWFNGLKLYLDD